MLSSWNMSNPKKKARKDKDQPKPQVVKITLPSDRQNWDRNLPAEHGKFVYIVVVRSRAESSLEYADSVIFGADKGFRKAVLFVHLVIQLCRNDPNVRSKLWVKFTVRIGCFIVRIRDIVVRNTMTFVRITFMLLTRV